MKEINTIQKKKEPSQAIPFFPKIGNSTLDQPSFFGQNALVQRQPGDAALQTPDLISGSPQQVGAPVPTFQFSDKFEEFGKFDARYTPVGPIPSEGKLEIFLWVNINFEDFSTKRKNKDPYRNFKFTQEQLKDFKWTDAEKQKFELDFMTSVEKAWSRKFKFHLKDPLFAEYKSNVEITVFTVDDPKLAHTKINALKIPKGAPRFRSFVKGKEATLDIRDPSENKKNKANVHDFIRQIGSFGFDSAETTQELKDQIAEVAAFIKSDPDPDKWSLVFEGRASSQGSKEYNQKLSNKRSEAVRLELFKQMGWNDAIVSNYFTITRGEEHATADAKFRRVDIIVTRSSKAGTTKDVEQNVAAHEAGHMFGLGDEYIRETDLMEDEQAKFLADKPTHYESVKGLMGKEAADELLIDNSESIMSVGNVVKKGHYVFFLAALNKMTSKKWNAE